MSNVESKEKNNSNEFINKLKIFIADAKTAYPKIMDDTIGQGDEILGETVHHFFYGMLIVNHFNNSLNKENMGKYNIPSEEVVKIRKYFSKLFEQCKPNEGYLEEIINEAPVLVNDVTCELSENKWLNASDYEDYFKEGLSNISKNSCKLLIDIEKLVDIDSCEKLIFEFEKEIYKIDEKALELAKINYLEEVTDFNNFSLSIDNGPMSQWVTIKDDKGRFSGIFNFSNNKEYIITYQDAYSKEDEKGQEHEISGQVYLIQNQNKILWEKDISRPQKAYVTNEGTSVVIGFRNRCTVELHKVYFIDKNGCILNEYEFKSLPFGKISDDGYEIIIEADAALSLFSVSEGKLIKKVKNNLRGVFARFKFEEVKKYVNEN